MNPSLAGIYDQLYSAHGPQGWWPADSALEVMVGAVLTQNAAWTNVEKALERLRECCALELPALLTLPTDQLAEAIRPSGYFNVKARRLRALLEYTDGVGGVQALAQQATDELRAGLLGVHGIGPETADDIVLYAFDRPVFVIDAYTRRLFSRLGLLDAELPYEAMRARFERHLPAEAPLYNEYHALIVRHAKDICRKGRPRCDRCVLRPACPAAESLLNDGAGLD